MDNNQKEDQDTGAFKINLFGPNDDENEQKEDSFSYHEEGEDEHEEPLDDMLLNNG